MWVFVFIVLLLVMMAFENRGWGLFKTLVFLALIYILGVSGLLMYVIS